MGLLRMIWFVYNEGGIELNYLDFGVYIFKYKDSCRFSVFVFEDSLEF